MTIYRYSPDAKRQYAQFHHDVAGDMGSSNAVTPSSLQSTQGAISFAADNATTSTGSSRSSAYSAVAGNSQEMGDLLTQAAQAYERGDNAAAEQLRARAEQLGAGGDPAGGGGAPGGATPGAPGSGVPATPGSGATGTPASADGGGQAAGQMMGQMAGMVGGMVQGIAQPIGSMMQGLMQMPEQALQGAQSIVEAAAGGGAGTGAEDIQKASGTDEEGADGKKDGAEGKKDGERAPVDAAREHEKSDKQQDGKADGNGAGKGSGSQQLGNRAESSVAPKPDHGPTAPTRPM